MDRLAAKSPHTRDTAILGGREEARRGELKKHCWVVCTAVFAALCGPHSEFLVGLLGTPNSQE